MSAPIYRPGDVEVIRAAIMRQLALKTEAIRKGAEKYEWHKIARPAQLTPGEPGSFSNRTDWRVWFLMAGRGFGKTRTGAETVRDQVKSGRRRHIAFVAPTLDDARKLMIDGRSGIRTITPLRDRPEFIAHKRELRWPNGAIGYIYTSKEPERLRGPEHDFAWCEELGAWQYPQRTWDMMSFGLRVTGPKGDRPQVIVTSTPRPLPTIKAIVRDDRTVISTGTTYDNEQNLDADFLRDIKAKYEGTRLGRQELLAKLLEDTPGALWTMKAIDDLRVLYAPELKRIVVSIDPAVKDPAKVADDGEGSEIGMVAAGIGTCRCKGEDELHGFVLEDLSGYMTPKEWAEKSVQEYRLRHADRIVAEINNGGVLVESNIRSLGGDANVSYRGVSAAKGKETRAEPISSLYEQGKVHHVGSFAKLEDQMTTWRPLHDRKSPDRVDALVWGLTDLMLGHGPDSYKPRGGAGNSRVGNTQRR